MRRWSAVLIAAWLLTPAADNSLRAQDLVPWRQGVVRPRADAGFWWMAAEGGFAKSQNLNLRMVPFDTDLELVKALRAGEIDSFEGSPINPMIATSMGGDLKIIGCTWPKLTFSFFAQRGIASLADLAGKTVGTSPAGALPDLVARAMLGRVAIEPQDVNFVAVGGEAERVRALAGRSIDAAVAGTELAVRADVDLRMLARANDILPSFVRACVITRGDVWRKRPEDLERLLAATSNGYAHALANRGETLALTRRIAKLPPGDPTAEAAYEEVVANRSLSPSLEIDIGKLQWLRDFLAEDGRIDQDFEPGTMTDSAMRVRSLARAKAAQ
ncbi:MAG TPA: ABC transporter substrate-binding protein [Xanthobacteraceae bacterium]|jgi:NitT/TauT family transport system substrate-binding protein